MNSQHHGIHILVYMQLLVAIVSLSCTSLSAQDEKRETVDVIELSIAEIHAGFIAKEFTAEQITKAYLDRIETLDQSTGLNSMVVLNPRALERARELDQQFGETGKLLPLHGIPVIVKDNYDTHDLQTAAGSIALKGSLPPDDAYQVKRLREAGAIVLGKSNMAEWAYSAFFTESTIAGTTRNPYDLSRVPAGSSGGTAAAVAASFGTVGLGTDTGNSIRGPASHCGLVGIRPTQGLTSRDGIVPLFLRNDIGGPLCRTVEDAARVLEVIAGWDPNDPVTEKAREKKFDYVSGLDKQGLKGVRIGVLRALSDVESADPEFKVLFEAALKDLEQNGAVLIDPFAIAKMNRRELSRLQNDLWVDTFRHDVGEYLATLGDDAPIKSLDDIIAFREYDEFLTQRLNASKRSQIPERLKQPYSADARDDPNRLAFLNQVVESMDASEVDVFVFPTWNNPPRKIGDLSSPDGNNSYFISPPTGLPAITVPMGFDEQGLPAGLQIVGREFSERLLFKTAYAYEQATQHRRPPARFDSRTQDSK